MRGWQERPKNLSPTSRASHILYHIVMVEACHAPRQQSASQRTALQCWSPSDELQDANRRTSLQSSDWLPTTHERDSLCSTMQYAIRLPVEMHVTFRTSCEYPWSALQNSVTSSWESCPFCYENLRVAL